MLPTEHRGKPIRKYSVALRGASADALNNAMKVNPQDLDVGKSAFMVIEVMPNGDNYKPMDDGDAWEHIDILKVVAGAFVTEDAAVGALNEVKAKVEEMRVAETGQERLGVDDEKIAEHDRGEHKRARKDCPRCQEIKAAGEAERAGATSIGNARGRRGRRPAEDA